MLKNSTEDTLRSELARLGAREFETVALTMEPKRGLAALAYALSKGAEHPISYAIKVFDNETWQPTAEKARFETNRAVNVQCQLCGGDRFIVASTRKPRQSAWMKDHEIAPREGWETTGGFMENVIEEMQPCPQCNANAKI